MGLQEGEYATPLHREKDKQVRARGFCANMASVVWTRGCLHLTLNLRRRDLRWPDACLVEKIFGEHRATL